MALAHIPRDSGKEKHNKISLRRGKTAYRMEQMRPWPRQRRHDLVDVAAPTS